jgi:MOSC domain-containing protein
MLTLEPLGPDREIRTVELPEEQVMQTDATPSGAGQTGGWFGGGAVAVSGEIDDGKELNSSEVTERGLLGDRQFAVVDRATGKVGGSQESEEGGQLL